MDVTDEVSFWSRLGFKANPFQYTNADQEDELHKYFVPPQYFPSVWGDPQKPQSCVVFAPRGGGKSAQRRMIENQSIGSKVLALQYTRFEFRPGMRISDIDIEYHLKNIIRICLIGFLMQTYENKIGHMVFNATEKRQVKDLCNFYLHDMNTEAVSAAVNAIMSPAEKAKKLFYENSWVIGPIIQILAKTYIGIDLFPLTLQADDTSIRNVSKTHLENILLLIKKLGYDSVYVLIDKVDETSLTSNNAQASFDLIAPMLKDLELLQMGNIAFKFFLWDEITPSFIKYARPDRITAFNMTWLEADLKNMMTRRLCAYSNNGKRNFGNLFDAKIAPIDVLEELLSIFSQNSPRDMIRICRQMAAEQLKINPSDSHIGMTAATEGINRFCLDRAREVVSTKILEELQKTHRLDFTVNYVANDIFKIDQNAARAKITSSWVVTGIIRRIDDTHIKGVKKPAHHFAVMDSRIARSIFPELNFLDFLENKVRECKCGEFVLRDWDISSNQICQKCKTQMK